jgi:hypothetical protein
MAKSSSRTTTAHPGVRFALWVAVTILAGGALCLASRTVWQAMTRRPEFELNPLALGLSGCPEWVNAQQMSLELRKELADVPSGRSVFDRDIVAAVRDELRRSPWVLDVTAVRRELPNSLQVKAIFRKPMGLVLMGGRQYLVDADGYWLREDLFSRPREWDSARMPVIVDSLLGESPPVGERWDGPRLAVGARLSELCRRGGLFERLPVVTIDVTRVGRGQAEPEIALIAASGAVIKWGKSSVYEKVPGLTAPVYLKPDSEKIEMLLSKLQDYPSLEGIQFVDLRFHNQIVFAKRD